MGADHGAQRRESIQAGKGAELLKVDPVRAAMERQLRADAARLSAPP